MADAPFTEDKMRSRINTYIEIHWDQLVHHPRNDRGEPMSYADLIPVIIKAYEYHEDDFNRAANDLNTYREHGIYDAIKTITANGDKEISPADFGNPVTIANHLLKYMITNVFTQALDDSGPDLQLIEKTTLDTFLSTLRGENYIVHDDYGHQLTINNPRELDHLAGTVEFLQDALHTPNLKSLTLVSDSLTLPNEFGHKRYSITDAIKILERLGLMVEQ